MYSQDESKKRILAGNTRLENKQVEEQREKNNSCSILTQELKMQQREMISDNTKEQQ